MSVEVWGFACGLAAQWGKSRALLAHFLMGGTLPVLIRRVSRNSAELGRRLAELYWINTIGVALGAFGAGFLLLEALGLQPTVVAVAPNLVTAALALRIGAREPSATDASPESSSRDQALERNASFASF